jgi:glyoxylate/hydroxypyruvate reductase
LTVRAIDVLLSAASETAQWRDAFASELSDVRLHVWPDTPGIVDFAIVWKPPVELFERVRVRRAIFNLGAGVDGLLGVPNLPRDVPIVRLEDAGMAVQMAEYVTLAVLRAYREQDAYALQQRERRWQQRPRLAKADFAIGLLGFGVLGQAVAGALRAFEFPLLGWSRSPRTISGVTMFSGQTGLREVLARARVLVVLLPATPETRGFLDRTTLGLLPAGAHLVNVARGSLVVEDDLIDLLDAGHLASATLDVFQSEPLPSNHRFWHHPKIMLTPHVSAATLVDESAAQVGRKLRAVMRNEPVTGVVNTQRGY